MTKTMDDILLSGGTSPDKSKKPSMIVFLDKRTYWRVKKAWKQLNESKTNTGSQSG